MRFAFASSLLLLLFPAQSTLFAQTDHGVVIFHKQSSHTSFPDSSRFNGHVRNQVFYNAADHYSDSQVLIIAPKNLHADQKVDLIFWFHGWHNNIDSAAAYYGPKDESQRMITKLKQEQIPFLETEESVLTAREIQNNHLIFMHNLGQHNDIIFNPDNFKFLFENSPLLIK